MFVESMINDSLLFNLKIKGSLIFSFDISLDEFKSLLLTKDNFLITLFILIEDNTL